MFLPRRCKATAVPWPDIVRSAWSWAGLGVDQLHSRQQHHLGAFVTTGAEGSQSGVANLGSNSVSMLRP
jgi:hypothetical protein